jgi:choice-of-anchor B domain-containing protein
MAQISLAGFGTNANTGADSWGYTSPSGREYALMTMSNAISFVEITNPSNPSIVATFSEPSSLWHDVKVYQSYAYIVSEAGGGIRTYNMSNIDNGSVSYVGSTTTGGSSASHNVAVDTYSGMLYRCGGGGSGLRIYNLSNPASPSYVGSWNTRYVHDAQVVTYTSGPYAGKQIAFCCTDAGSTEALDILDVTNPNNVITLDTVTYPNSAYAHQGWLSEDRQYFYLGDELDEGPGTPTTTHVIDVSNLSNSFHQGSFTNGNPAIGHNLYTHNGYCFQANYTSGLRIFDLNQSATNPPEVAYFDTYPSSNSVSFNGLWNVFPYFPSGTVIGSDMQGGLFVWRFAQAPVVFDYPSGRPDYLAPGGDTVNIHLTETTPGALAPGTETLHYNAGAGWITSPLTNLGGGAYIANFPALSCGATVEWFLSVQDADGLDWTDPSGNPYTAIVAEGETLFASFDMESAAGWTGGVSGDTATTGSWTRGNPIGTDAQPNNDHSSPGSQCWFTGQGSTGGSLGENDVDGGITTLLSPVMDLSGSSDPIISYWRWYSNNTGADPGADVFEVDISSNGGSSWVTVEVVGPTGSGTSGGWVEHSFRAADLISLTANVRMRFIAGDLSSGSIIEAAVDDLEIADLVCANCGGTNYCAISPNTAGGGSVITSNGDASIATNNFSLSCSGAVPQQFGIFYFGPSQTSAPFGHGVRCVNGQTRRLPVLQADFFGDAAYDLDFATSPASDISADSTWYFQFWHRDPAAGAPNFNLSNGLEVLFCP